MTGDVILQTRPLGRRWEATDPFLFCVHHDDAYPPGDARMAPQASLAGRQIGQDFSAKDGWSMYHGEDVPGFPAHPHRGFETVTLVREGWIDHSDSLGATARFGQGDAQWLTAGKGIVHSEMFPLLRQDQGNRLELFQIWLNLPSSHKLSQPHFTMLWGRGIPRGVARDVDGRATEVEVVAGRLVLEGAELRPPAPPPDSWAAQADADVAIWTLRMEAGASWTLPPAASRATQRTLYFFNGSRATVAGRSLENHAAVVLRSDVPVQLTAGPQGCEFLLLQGRPIAEPVAQYGPFVMNTEAEVMQAVQDYRRTEFGGWPFSHSAPVHPRGAGRFARYPDGRVEEPDA